MSILKSILRAVGRKPAAEDKIDTSAIVTDTFGWSGASDVKQCSDMSQQLPGLDTSGVRDMRKHFFGEKL